MELLNCSKCLEAIMLSVSIFYLVIWILFIMLYSRSVARVTPPTLKIGLVLSSLVMIFISTWRIFMSLERWYDISNLCVGVLYLAVMMWAEDRKFNRDED